MAPTPADLRAFDEAMHQIYVRAKSEVGYTASRFHQMLQEHGGVETAHRLLPDMSDGFAKLWEKKRLDLTVEFLVLEPRWHSLFTDAEREVARARLRDSGMEI